ncbi:hypothetical protein [Halalkalicoccus jeotgali]|nr:hypothetical protein [Halalkalicoccus jeotgali]
MSSTGDTPPEDESIDDQPPLHPLIARLMNVFQNPTRVPTAYLAAGTAIGLLVIIASTPAAAQEFCDDPAGQLLISIETMLINYGTMLLFLAFLIGVAMWALTPIFAGQSAIGLGMILLSFGAAIALVVGTQFFGMTFEIAGAGGQSCSTVLN